MTRTPLALVSPLPVRSAPRALLATLAALSWLVGTLGGPVVMVMASSSDSEAQMAVQVQCVGTESTSYDPGLLLTPRFTQRETRTIYAPCLSVADPAVTAGTVSVSAFALESCLELLDSGNTTRVIHWNTGETSTWELTFTAQHVGGNIVVAQTGAITAGKFAGSTAIGTVTLLAPPITACLSEPGVTNLQGPATLTILL